MKTLIYDLPTRFFHWLFAFLFLAAFIIAKVAEDENILFPYHMLAGLALLFVLFLRIIWGFTGTIYARFTSFKLQPSELIQYFRDTISGRGKRYPGHNPASGYAALLMFLFATGLGITGIFMTSGNETEFYEEAHEVLANLFLATVIVHVAGLLIHHLQHSDSLWLSMINGRKDNIPGESKILNSKSVTGIFFLILSLSAITYLNYQYHSQNRTVNLFGNTLQLGENDDDIPGQNFKDDEDESNSDDD